ncbi:hydroxylysine kinase-like [Saccoglossus kowalevskii]
MDEAASSLDDVIKPTLSLEDVNDLVSRLYNITAQSIKQLDSYDDQNFHIVAKSATSKRSEYVLKIINANDSKNEVLLDAQTQMMLQLIEKGFVCPNPIRLPTGEYMTLEPINGQKGCFNHMVRLLSYIPGMLYKSVDMTSDLCYHAGQHLGRMHMALKGFQHEGLNRPDFLWNLVNTHRLEKYVNVFSEERQKIILNFFIKMFKEKVIPKYPLLAKGAIHGDFNEFNILVAPKEVNSNIVTGKSGSCTYEICGILDFGDVQYNYYVFDAAIAIMYTMLQSQDPITAGGHVLAGYLSTFPLSELELDLIYYCIGARICQSLILGMYTYTLHPTNTYLLATQETGWKVLELLYSTSKEEIEKAWNKIVSSSC